MVKAVRIASVVALVFSGLVLALLWGPIHPFGLGAPDNEKAEEFLRAPSAVERFNGSRGAGDSADQDKTSPLVKQASLLEGILKPRIELPAQASSSSRTAFTSPPPKSVKFDLIGISYSASDPQTSFAFIRLPDNTYQWIQQGSDVGHQTVKEIKSGSIVCSDGQRLSEIMVEATPNTATLLETGAAASVAATASGLPSPGGVRPLHIPGVRPPVPGSADAIANPGDSPRLSGQDQEGLNELVHRLKQELQKNPTPGQADSNSAAADQTAALDKLVSEIKSSQSSRVSAEEAEKLDNLGEQLNEATEKRASEKHRELMRRLTQKRSPQQ